MSAKSKAFKNLMFSSTGLYVEYFLGMLVSIIIARALGPEVYGEYALILWLCAFGTMITNGGVTTALIKFVAECRVKHEGYVEYVIKYVKNIQYIKYVLVLILFLALYVFREHSFYKDFSFELLLLLVVAIALRASHMFYFSLAKGFENFKLTALIVSIAAPLNLILVIGAALLFQTLNMFVAVYIISSFIFFIASKTISQKKCVVHKTQTEIPDEFKTRINSHVKLVMLNTFLMFIITKDSELLFLKYFSDAEDLGIFKVAHRLSTGVALLLPGLFGAIMLPLMSSSIAQSKEIASARFVSCLKYILILAVPASLFFASYSHEIISLLYGEVYIRAVVPFSVIVATCCICSIGSVASGYLLSVDKQSLLLKIVVCGTIVKLILDYALISQYFLMGAIVAFSVSIFLMFLCNMIIALRHLGLKFPWAHAMRVTLAGGISLILSFLVPDTFHILLTLGLAAIVYFLSYLVLSLVLKCWGSGELQYIRNKITIDKYKVLKPVDMLLSWASK